MADATLNVASEIRCIDQHSGLTTSLNTLICARSGRVVSPTFGMPLGATCEYATRIGRIESLLLIAQTPWDVSAKLLLTSGPRYHSHSTQLQF